MEKANVPHFYIRKVAAIIFLIAVPDIGRVQRIRLFVVLGNAARIFPCSLFIYTHLLGLVMHWDILVQLLEQPDFKSTLKELNITVALEQKMFTGLTPTLHVSQSGTSFQEFLNFWHVNYFLLFSTQKATQTIFLQLQKLFVCPISFWVFLHQ